jgi:NADPH-dependent curcumin reductase CurA
MATEEDVPFRDVLLADPGPDEVVIRNLYISLDPAICGWMGDAPNYMEPVTLGDAVRSTVIGRVVKSASPDFTVGDVALTMGGWKQYTTVPVPMPMLNKLDDSNGIPLSHFLSVLGPTGLTAYFGVLDVAQPKSGDTLLVSGAAGAAGSIVG